MVVNQFSPLLSQIPRNVALSWFGNGLFSQKFPALWFLTLNHEGCIVDLSGFMCGSEFQISEKGSVRNGVKLSNANRLILLFQVRTNPVRNLPNKVCLWG